MDPWCFFFFAYLLTWIADFYVTLPKTNIIAPENGPDPKWKVVSQPPSFRGYVSFREGKIEENSQNDWRFDVGEIMKSWNFQKYLKFRRRWDTWHDETWVICYVLFKVPRCKTDISGYGDRKNIWWDPWTPKPIGVHTKKKTYLLFSGFVAVCPRVDQLLLLGINSSHLECRDI